MQPILIHVCLHSSLIMSRDCRNKTNQSATGTLQQQQYAVCSSVTTGYCWNTCLNTLCSHVVRASLFLLSSGSLQVASKISNGCIKTHASRLNKQLVETCSRKWWPSKKSSVAWVHERTIPTERPPLVGGVSANFFGYKSVAWSARRLPTSVF
jgi:hypothetical protein